MRTYKLTYFNAEARGEVSRLLFALADVAYEDVRVEFEKWPKLKPNTPFGALPTLEVDGKTTICDSQAVARYLAKEFGFMGRTILESAKIDMIMQCTVDAIAPVIKMHFEKDSATKAKLVETYKKEDLPKFVKFLEAQLGGKDWLVGNCVTVADVCVVQGIVGAIQRDIGADAVKSSAKITALIKRFNALPNIAKYISKRPKAAF